MMKLQSFIVAIAMLVFAPAVIAVTPVKVLIAEDGKALLPIIISENASASTKSNASKLAEYLGKIGGAKFKIETGDGTSGISIGLATDFPALKLASTFKSDDILKREEYLLRTHAGGLLVLGASDLAVQHGVWDLLSRLGYRQFFPGKNWEVVPYLQRMELGIDTLEKPDYHSRRIWYGYGAWDYAKEPYRDWCEKNRALQGVNLNTGHAYDGIVKALKKEFSNHNEYWPLLNNERKEVRNPKPCLGNPDLRSLIVKNAVGQVKKTRCSTAYRWTRAMAVAGANARHVPSWAAFQTRPSRLPTRLPPRSTRSFPENSWVSMATIFIPRPQISRCIPRWL